MDEQDRKLQETKIRFMFFAFVIGCVTSVAYVAFLAGEKTSLSIGISLSIGVSLVGAGGFWKILRQRTDLQRAREARISIEARNRELDGEVAELETYNRELELAVRELETRLKMTKSGHFPDDQEAK